MISAAGFSCSAVCLHTHILPAPSAVFIALLWLALESGPANICLLLWLFLLTQIGVVILEGGDPRPASLPGTRTASAGDRNHAQIPTADGLYLLSQFNHLNTHKKSSFMSPRCFLS